MKKIFFIMSLALLVYAPGYGMEAGNTVGATSYWKPMVLGQLQLSQSAFENWVSGGQNTLAWQVNIKSGLNYKKDGISWVSNGKIQYGQTKLEGADAKKSADEVVVDSRLIYALSGWINPYVGLNWQTQLTDGYNYAGTPIQAVSGFMDPGYLTESLGLGYAVDGWLTTRLGLAAKQTFADRFAATYTDKSESDELEKMKNEIGLESITELTLKLTETIAFASKLSLFSNLKALDQTDIKWENQFAAQLSSWLSVNLNVDLVYDKDVSPIRQLKEVLSLGVTYNFI